MTTDLDSVSRGVTRPVGDRQAIGILMLMPSGWGDVWTGRHQISARLAREFPLVWLTPPESWQRALSSPARPRFTPAEGAPGIDVYTPPRYLPQVYRPGWLQDALFARRLAQAAARLRARGAERVVLYIWRPTFVRAPDLLPHALSVYHINDEYSFSAQDEGIPADEARLIGRVDQVIIHSPELMRRKGGLNARTAMIPNGVDFRAFSTPVLAPDEFAHIPRPRIGYVGWLKRHLDWPLLERLVAGHPSWSFVFVGPQSPHPELDPVVARLQRQPNVWFLGRQPAVRLPGYVQQLDVCLLPYLDNAYTRCIYPLKVHEYLAAGHPVVGTRLPSLEPLREVVRLVDDPAQWDEALTTALSADAVSGDARARRQAVAASHDWDTLVARVKDVLLAALSEQPDVSEPPGAGRARA
jgi:glycosyltransferase involved in cell wall biosynthesis